MPSLHHQYFTQLFRQHYTWLRGRLSLRMGCPHNAEDITAETFVRLLTMRETGIIHEPRALLTTIAKRLMWESWRRRDLERAYLEAVSQVEEAVQPSPEEQALLIETLVTIDRMLDELPGQGKAAFILSQFSGLTYPQIAEQLDLSLSRVQQYMTEAFKLCYKAANP